MRIELVISTYNSPRVLRLTLLSATRQDRQADSICIADDGSGPETKAMIETCARAFPALNLRHVWHEDRGFEKNAILNKAVASSTADLMIFTDGDCLMHPGFIARHAELAHPRRYCCGSLVRLTAEATAQVSETDVLDGTVFDRGWLARRGTFRRLTTRFKAGVLPRPLASLLERVSPVRRTWSGSNASAHRDAIIAVNGFDEQMKYGGEDKEFGVRLRNYGIKGRHLRFTAPLIHLDHKRGYVDRDQVRENRARIADVRRSGRFWTPNGLVKSNDEMQD